MFLRRLPALGISFGVALGVALVTTRALAADTTPVRIAIDTPDGCSSVRAFFEAVRARTDRIHLATRPKEGLELRVSVVRVEDKVRGELRVIDEQGGTSTRSVEGTTCDEVVRALSLTAALVLDQLVPPVTETSVPAPRGAAGESPDGSRNVPGTPSPETGAASPSRPESKSQAAPNAAPERVDDEDDEEDEDSREVDSDASTPFVDPELYDETVADRPRVFEVDVGAAGVIGQIVSPRVSVGGALFVTVSDTSDRAFSPSFGLAVAHVPAEFAQSGGDVSVRWTAAILSACPLRFRAGDLSFHPCAFGTGGLLDARGETSDTPKTASRSWWSAGALGRVGAAIGGGTSVRIELGLSVPFYRRRFVTTPPEETVGESPDISVLGALGVAHVF